MKYWNGTSWINKPLKYWNGTSWVSSPLNWWNGTQWTHNSVDADAQAFLTATGITDSTQTSAINNLVVSLKNNSLWTKIIALYPMVGGTTTTCKYNLIDPRDLDAAYRLTFAGTPTISSTGFIASTNASLANMNIVDDGTIFTNTNASLFYYSRTNNTTSGYDMGWGNSPWNELAIYFPADVSRWYGNTFHVESYTTDTLGFYHLTVTAGTTSVYKNGSLLTSVTGGSGAYCNTNGLLGGTTDVSNVGVKECALAGIGFSFSSTEASTFYTIVQAYQTALSRNV